MRSTISSADRSDHEEELDERLSRRSASFKAVFEHAAIGIGVVDMDGRPTGVNPALVRMLGYSPAELAEMTFPDFTHPDDVQIDVELFSELMAGKRDSYRLEKRYLSASGEIVWGRLAVSLIRDESGEPEFALAMVEDVTELRRTEEALRRSEEEHRGAQKMEAIGRLAGGIAHDFNNLLTVVLGSADMLDADTADERPREQIGRIRDAAERAAALTRQLLAFARRQRLDIRVTHLNHLIEETLTLLRRVIPSDIAIEWQLDPNLGSVRADASQFEQVIMNLALNARDAMPTGGLIRITTANVTLDDGPDAERGAVPPGDYVVVTVSDSGVGMDAATAERVFEPFFTTKADRQGTGLGLATVYGIVKQSEGFIVVESEPDHGTSFTIYLPRAHEAVPEPVQPVEAPLPVTAGTATILVVDDEPVVRVMLTEMLAAHGYAVVTAATAAEALELAAQDHVHIDLVVSDLVMPGMGGAELVEKLEQRSDRPIRALYVSGYSDDRQQPEAEAHFLQKPFSTETLVRAVGDALAG